MKRTIKLATVTFALAAFAQAFAQDVEEKEPTVGWTPIALGIATPVQLPWGIDRWDVYGLDLNLIYCDAPEVIGLQFGGAANLSRRGFAGLALSTFCNAALEDVYGVRATVGLNLARKAVKGLEIGGIAFRDTIAGADVNILGAAQHNVCGFQLGGLGNLTSVESYGCTIGGLFNLARTAYGLQLACIYNMTDELHGAQIGLVNYADYCPNGFQIGLVNIVMSNQLKVLPFINGYF